MVHPSHMIHGERVAYDLDSDLVAMYRCFGTNDLGVKEYKIQWDTLVDHYERLIVVICSVVVGVICL